jgi:hypothetical protein
VIRLVMTLLVRNEEEVLAANLDYHLAQGVDFVIVTDHGSTDATPEILRDYERAGVVRTIRAEGTGHHQSRRVTRMARLAYVEHGADWVINNDADEFWWPAMGSLADVLAAVPPEYGQIIAPRNNFLPVSYGEGEAFHQRLIVRERRSLNLKGDPLEPKVAHRGHPSVVVAPGNHNISWVGLWPTPADVPLLEVLHFPMRTYAQFEAKVVTVGHGYEALPFRSEEVGRDQLHLLGLHRMGRLRNWYEERLPKGEELARRLADGSLVIDDRLARFMLDCGADSDPLPPNGRRPGSESARAAVAAAFRETGGT